MAYTLPHAFVSAKSDGIDTTIVQPSNWNAQHVLGGGTRGDLLVYDATQATHINGVVAVAVGQVLISKGAITTPAWSGSLGLNVAAPATAGCIAATLGANNVTGLLIKRNTDAAPTGNFVDYQNAAAASLWTVDITGSLTAGSVPNARLAGSGQITVTGTANQISVTGSPVALGGTVTLSTPQDIATASTPRFARLGLGQAADANAVLALLGADGKSTLLLPTVTYTSNMTSIPMISIIATENTGAGTHDLLFMNITRTAGNYRFINFQTGATSKFTVDQDGNLLLAAGAAVAGVASGLVQFVGYFAGNVNFAANTTLFDTTGTRASSNTGADATTAWNLAHTWNTSGNATVFKIAVTETAKGATSRYFSILGGAAGATDEFYVETGGATYCKGTITTGGAAVVANTNVFGSTCIFNSSLAINSGGTAAPMGSALVLGWTASASINGGTAIDTGLFRNGAGVVEVNNGTTGTYRDLQLRNLLASAKLTNYNSIATAGLGLPAIYSAPATSATKTANFTVLTYTPPATAGTYRVSGVITTTSSTNTGTVQFTVDYTDSQGTVHTADIIALQDAAGVIATTKTGASKEFHAVSWVFTINNAATNIVLKVVVTGSVSYTVAGSIEQIQ